MSVKRILIIQTDDMYFLHETLEVLSANLKDLSHMEVSVLVSPRALEVMRTLGVPIHPGVTTDISRILSSDYDMSFNLSLNEAAWQIHSDVKAGKKAGPFYRGNELVVNGVWSSWFLTMKGNTPFVTFHMREIYRQILGLKKRAPENHHPAGIKTLIVGLSSPEFFPPTEQEAFLSGVVRRFPGLQVLDESEVSPEHDHSFSLYLGPASMKGLVLCENGSRGVFIGSRFQGLNLLPEREGTMLITTSGKKMDAQSLLEALEIIVKDKDVKATEHLNIYRMSMENVFGAYLECLKGQEISYPYYQAHLVLWNYLLALQDVNIDILPPSEEQAKSVGDQLEIVSKLKRLHSYAMVALDTVYKEAKKPESDGAVIEQNFATLTEVDETFDKISATNPFLRPLIDFYKIRKGQIEGETLLEKSQNSLLTYSEEHKALSALEELFLTIKNKK